MSVIIDGVILVLLLGTVRRLYIAWKWMREDAKDGL